MTAKPLRKQGQLKNSNNYAKEEPFIRYALDNAAIVAITDVKGNITYVNNKFCEISGYDRDELIGNNHRLLKSGNHSMKFFKDMYRQIASGNIWSGEICNKNKSGSIYWVETTIVPHINAKGKVDSYTSIRFDITSRKQTEEELQANKNHLNDLANIDSLSGLANRRKFHSYLSECIEISSSKKTNFYLALMDVDEFKEVNDSDGHDSGDNLLKKISELLKATLGSSAFLARIGGDEFGIVFTNTSSANALSSLNNFLSQLRTVHTSYRGSRRCSASIGFAYFPSHGDTIKTLFKAADIALYSAKSQGRDRVCVFDYSLLTSIDERIHLLRDVDQGLNENQFELYYQPIVAAKSDKKTSLEALLRWKHPSGEIRTPAQFETALEDEYTSKKIGQFILQSVFNDAQKMKELHIEPDFIAINLTNADLNSDDFIDRFVKLANETGIAPSCFCVEITERILLSKSRSKVYDGLQRLHNLGVKIAFDDFGTGYASLTHLRELPIDYVKIDKSFVKNMEASITDQAIIEGIIHISHKMGKRVVIEGVETPEQLKLLKQMGGDDLQGWLFSPAQPINKLPEAILNCSGSNLI